MSMRLASAIEEFAFRGGAAPTVEEVIEGLRLGCARLPFPADKEFWAWVEETERLASERGVPLAQFHSPFLAEGGWAIWDFAENVAAARRSLPRGSFMSLIRGVIRRTRRP